jgi:5-methylcytosine-specific restriction protein A
MTERVRGRRGVAMRKRRLANEPLCRICKSKGRVTEATVPDHIKPLALGGTDTDDNIRCLCEACHTEATAEQFGHRKRTEVGVDGWPSE